MQNASKSQDMYSPPLSSCKVPNLCPVTFSAQALNCLNAANASDLCFRRYTALKREWSSMKVIQNLYSWFVEIFTRPWTSLWTSWRGLDALECEIGKGFACILPALQASHTRSGSARESSLRPFTRLPESSFLMPAKWWWQRRWCHKVKSIIGDEMDESGASCCKGMVSLRRKAELEAETFAWK